MPTKEELERQLSAITDPVERAIFKATHPMLWSEEDRLRMVQFFENVGFTTKKE